MTPKALKVALKELPKGSNAYDQAYEEAMGRIEAQPKDRQDLAKQSLMWISCAKRQLKTLELRQALAIEIERLELDEDNLPDFEDIVSVCAGLVTVDEESDIIRLVHYTTQEYFERTWVDWFPTASEDLGRACVTYLLLLQEEYPDPFIIATRPARVWQNIALRSNIGTYSLFGYASEFWGLHVQNTLAEQDGFLLELLEDEKHIWKVLPRQSEIAFRPPTRAIHVVAYFGLNTTMSLLSPGPSGDAWTKDGNGRTAMMFAATSGQVDVVRVLVKVGVQYVNSRDDFGDSALSLAVRSENFTVAAELLRVEGVEVNVISLTGSTSLLLASHHGNLSIVKQLLLRGAEVDLRHRQDHRTPLHVAADGGFEAIVKQFLDAGARIDSRDKDGVTPLMLAASEGHEAIVKELVRAGAHVDATDHVGCTTLFMAARQHRASIVEFLLASRGAVGPRSDSDDETLSLASGNGILVTVKRMFKNDRSPDTFFPLILAATNGDFGVILQILQNGADLQAKCENGLPSLLSAVLERLEDIFLEVIQSGDSIDERIPEGSTPLVLAAAFGLEKAMGMLLAMGADPNAMDSSGETPLAYAASEGRVELVKQLLAIGADIDAESDEGETPLLVATCSAHSELENLLAMPRDSLRNPSDIETAWAYIKIVEHHKARRAKLTGCLTTVETLLAAGAKTTAEIERHWAVRSARECRSQLEANDD